MGTIFSGVGLVSGLNIQSLVDQLMAIEARPRDLLRGRMSNIDAQKTAFLDISARIAAILSRVTALSQASTFRTRSATTSNAEALSATVRSDAPTGSYSFIPLALSARQQLISRGFQSANSLLPTGSISFESAKARVNPRTTLAELNGMAGVQRGSFSITDAANQTRVIDVSDAVTVNDVLERVNAAGIHVQAELSGDAIVLRETTGGAIRVGEVNDGTTAASLGFRDAGVYSSSGRLVGADLIRLGEATGLRQLNDGNGIRRARAGGDFRFTTFEGKQVNVDLSGLLQDTTRVERLNQGAGASLGRVRITTADVEGHDVIREVDLTGARTIGEINATLRREVPGLSITLAGSKLLLSNAGAGDQKRIKIQDITGTGAADLGIAGEAADGRITGRDVLRVETINDVLLAINYGDGNSGELHAAIDGKRLSISTTVAGRIDILNDSKALADLGLTAGDVETGQSGGRIVGGINTTLLRTLNGGRGVELGVVQLDFGGEVADVDLAGAETLSDALERIKTTAAERGFGIDVGFNANGTGLVVRSTDGLTPIAIRDVSGDFAAVAGLANNATVVRGANLQRQYMSEATRLADVGDGRGVRPGRFRITDAMGHFATIDVSASSSATLGELIERINAASVDVTARMNDTGDGLLLTDTSGGGGKLKIVDESGTAARDLNIAGEASETTIDGSFEMRFDVTTGTTVQDLVDRINAKTAAPLTASLLNDGSSVAPLRIQLTARSSGLAGEFLIESDGLDLGLSTLSRAQDARLILGSSAQTGIMLSSSSDTFTNVLPGLDLTLRSATDSPVNVTVGVTTEAAQAALDGMVTAFNDALGRIKALSGYDVETEQGGVLLGDSALRTIESRLFRMISTRASRGGAISSLSQLGVKLEGGKLKFDSAKFQEVVQRDPQGVVDFFARAQTGLAVEMKKSLEEITQTAGLIPRRNEALDRTREDLDQRVTRLNDILERKRERLLRQYQAMESALSRLNSQQSALSSIFGSISSTSSGR